jgi:hypothetical protein
MINRGKIENLSLNLNHSTVNVIITIVVIKSKELRLVVTLVTFDHDLLDCQRVYSGLGVDRKIICSHDSDVWGRFRGLLLATNCHAIKYMRTSRVS